MTPNGVIAEVRRLISDTRETYRYSDTVLLGFVNDVIKRMVIARPDLFATIASIATTADTVVQQLPSGGVRLIEVYSVTGGSAVEEATREMLDRAVPTWMSADSGTPVNYVRHVRNPTRFFLYPPPTSGVTLLAEYATTPGDYAIDDDIAALGDEYFPALVDGVVFLAESVDNEHVNSGRAELFYKSFLQTLATGLSVRPLTDTEAGGMDSRMVV